MPILTRPGQNLQTSDNAQIGSLPAITNPMELHIAEYAGVVEGTIARKSIIQGWIPTRTVKGTSTIQTYRVGESTLAKVTPGTVPASSVHQAGKNTLTIDTLINARNSFFILDDFQSSYDARAEVGKEHGKKISKFYDQSFLIQAIKAARSTNAGLPAGWGGGSVETFTAAGDELDPAKLYQKLAALFAKFELKDVDPMADNLITVVRPDVYYALLQSNALIDATMLTSAGNSVQGKKLGAFGVPIYASNNLPQSVITGHDLSNAGNGAAYDGDFTKVVASVFAPNALLAGETIPLTSNVFYHDLDKCWYVDSHLSFGVTVNRPEYAGILEAA